jgi:hypothetical protein
MDQETDLGVSEPRKKLTIKRKRKASAKSASPEIRVSPKSVSAKSPEIRVSPKSPEIRVSPKSASPEIRVSPKSIRKISIRRKKSLSKASLSKASLSKASPSKASIRRSKRKKSNSSQKRKSAATKILNFLRQTKHTRKAHFLKALCSDAGVCLALGQFADEIKKHFGGFTSFDYVVPPIKRIGGDSENGFINQIEYAHRGYKSYAILKSAKTPNADNLLYEYVVGQYINRLNKQYPCFLETYGYYMYDDNATWLTMQNTPLLMDVNVLKDGLIQQKSIDYNTACKSSNKLAILIQSLQDIQSLHSLSFDPDFVHDELMAALFQLYLPLAQLKDTFTHYDLHLTNIYMYKPVADQYIEFYYWQTPYRAITFKSSYVLKIIDYGRSYFMDIENQTSAQQIYKKELCKKASDCNIRETTGKCGEYVGFSWLKKSGRNPKKNFYISAQTKNISHDLLPLTRIKENNTQDNNLTPELNALVNKVVYTDYFGTKELEDMGYPRAINNVQDAAQCITDEIMSDKFQTKNNALYAGKTKLGDLHIYLTGEPMKFVKA